MENNTPSPVHGNKCTKQPIETEGWTSKDCFCKNLTEHANRMLKGRLLCNVMVSD